MSKIIVIVILVFPLICSSNSWASKVFPEKLKDYTEYQLEADYSRKVELLEQFINNGLDDSELELFKAEIEGIIASANKANDRFTLNYAKFIYSYYHIQREQFKIALTLTNSALAYFNENDNSRLLGYLFRDLGIIRNGLGYKSGRITCFIKSQDHFKSCNMKMEYIHSRALEAKIRVEFKEYKEAARIIFGCIDKMEKYGKFKTIFGYYNFLSDLYSETENNSMVKYCNRKSAEYALKSGNENTIALSKNNLAISEFFENNIQGALQLFTEALETRKRLKKYKLVSESYYNIATVHSSNNQNEKAIEYFKKSLSVAISNNLLAESADAYIALSDLFEKTANLSMALKMNKKYLEIKEKTHLNTALETDILNTKLGNYEKDRIELKNKEKRGKLKSRVDLLIGTCGLLVAGYFLLFVVYSYKRNTDNQLSLKGVIK